MPKAIPKMKLGLLVGVLAGAVMLGSASSAAAKLVKSDSVSFKGTYNANGEWEATKCKLTSDGEFVPGTTKLEVFPCFLRGVAGPIGEPTISAQSEWGSADGEAAFRGPIPRIKSEPPKETYSGTITLCEEREEEEGKFAQYPCQARVKLVFNTLKNSVTGSYAIFEESTQP